MLAERGTKRIRLSANAARIARAIAGESMERDEDWLAWCKDCASEHRAVTGWEDGLCDACYAASHATCARCNEAWDRDAIDADGMCPSCCDERESEERAESEARETEESGDRNDGCEPWGGR